MWQPFDHALRVAGMGLVLFAGCSGLGGGVRPMTPEERAKFGDSYTTLRPITPTVIPSITPVDVVLSSTDEVAADALGRIGAPSVPELRAALLDPSPHVRKYAAVALAKAGPAAAPAVPELTQLLSDPDEEVRRVAARALGQIGPGARDAVPNLLNVIRKPEDHVAPTLVPAPAVVPAPVVVPTPVLQLNAPVAQ